jgi:hypothetical protein
MQEQEQGGELDKPHSGSVRQKFVCAWSPVFITCSFYPACGMTQSSRKNSIYRKPRHRLAHLTFALDPICEITIVRAVDGNC